MRVVQTFWSGNKDPLMDSFGWLSPQYNLMSWALSCLSLREHYDEVILYTDSTGYKILSEQLQLPYTDIIIQYDDLVCPEHHWAYPKLLTYSLQKKPFIHVDGDVYLPKRLSSEVESGALIAQNAEIGTSYYRSMTDAIMQNKPLLPPFLEEELNRESISSYNAGVIGGNDLGFIKDYCNTAFKFINENHLNDIYHSNINVNHNILFEQILFHALSVRHQKEVSTVLDHSVLDNGYTYQEFCDFYTFNKNDLMHIIGGHKRNPRICELLSRILLKKAPEYFNRVVELFPQEHRRINNQKKEIQATDSQQLLYYKFLDELSQQWSNISNKKLLDMDKLSSNYFEFLDSSEQERESMIIKKNPHLSIYEISQQWSNNEMLIMQERISKDYAPNKFDIACIPILLDEGYKEVLIDDLSYNILILLNTDRTFKTLLDDLKPSLYTLTKDEKLIYSTIMNKLEYLFYNKLIYTL